MTTTASATWSDLIKPFADAICKTPEQVAEALKTLIGDPSPEAFDLLKSEEYTPFDDLKAAFENVPVAKLKKAVADHLRAKAAPASAQQSPALGSPSLASPSLDVLPSVPDDTSFLASLKAGGELKVDRTTVISAIQAGFANRVGLYQLPAALVERMEAQAENLEEPVGPDFYRMRKLITRQSYAEIFAAMDGVEAQFVTQGRKTALLGKLDNALWPALFGFHGQLKSWFETWQQGASTPANMMAAMLALAGGGAGALPPGMMQPPPTDALRSEAEAVIVKINRVFAGTGIPVARALAYDALRIKEVLDNGSLPAQIGAANRDQMLKLLNVGVTSDVVRMERNVVRYALSIMDFDKVTGGNSELAYLTSLHMLGGQIQWERLQAPPRPASARMPRAFDER